MNRTEIRNMIETLAKSQGFYGRLLAAVDEVEPEKREKFWAGLEAAKIADPIDLVMYFEC